MWTSALKHPVKPQCSSTPASHVGPSEMSNAPGPPFPPPVSSLCPLLPPPPLVHAWVSCSNCMMVCRSTKMPSSSFRGRCSWTPASHMPTPWQATSTLPMKTLTKACSATDTPCALIPATTMPGEPCALHSQAPRLQRAPLSGLLGMLLQIGLLSCLVYMYIHSHIFGLLYTMNVSCAMLVELCMVSVVCWSLR